MNSEQALGLIAPAQRDRIHYRYGDRGDGWLTDLPQRLVDACERWQVELTAPIVPGGHSSCLFQGVTAAGGPVVLKMVFNVADAAREAAALAYWGATDSSRVPRLLSALPEQGELLLELFTPAVLASSLPDSNRLYDDLAALLGDLHRPVPAGLFPSVAVWVQRWVFDGDYTALLDTGLIGNAEIEQVQQLGKELLDSIAEPVIIHGDLHHDNVLRVGSRLVVIDPTGSTGEAAVDVAGWAAKRGDEALIAERSSRLGRRLGLDPDRVEGWTRVLALDAAKMYAVIATHEPERVTHLTAYLHRHS